MRASREISRSELVSMIARLRGALFTTLHEMQRPGMWEAERVLEQTRFDTSAEDLVDRCFAKLEGDE